ncbi:MAG: UMP kinase [Hyphomicrobium sp.]
MKSFNYKRVLFKISGEALLGQSQNGIDLRIAQSLAQDLIKGLSLGIQISLVVGGGNIFRGLDGVHNGMDRATSDYMGMLATVMNALALSQVIKGMNAEARVMSAIPMTSVCETYTISKAKDHISKGRIAIFAAGTGNPFFTTDTAAVLRAIETSSNIMIKATQVDGVYSSDPKKNKDAQRFDKLSYSDVLQKNLKVMDGTAVALARDNRLPVMVCSMKENGNILKVINGEAKATLIEE